MPDRALHDALRASQRLGMLGERPIDEVIEHAGAFVAALADVRGVVVDLGSGGGVPGLVLAAARPDLELVLVDRRATRTDHLARLVRRLAFDGRVTVRTGDVMTLALPQADAAVARGFGPPDVTLRAGVRCTRPGGVVVISEPPGGHADRWPPPLLASCGVTRCDSPDPRVAVFRHDVPRGT